MPEGAEENEQRGYASDNHRVKSKGKAHIYYVEVLGKTLDVLDVFGRSGHTQLSLQDLAAATKLNKNTVFRILYTLAEHGYVLKEGHSYQLGPKIADLGNARLHRPGLLAVAGPYLSSLRDRFGETVNLGILDEGRIRYIDVRESRERFRLAERVGGSDPLHSTALGKAHLAFLPPEQVRRLIKDHGMAQQTDQTIKSLSALRAELGRVRALGYAVDREESMLGAFCVGMPIFGPEQIPVAAISISGPTMRFNESILPKVIDGLAKAIEEIQKRIRS
jgi:IclR family transcriptional regulator, KDG regulon repressor